MASKSTRSKAEKQAKPFGCAVKKCNQYFKSEKDLLKHYKKEHPKVPIQVHEDGSFTVDLREMPKSEKPKKNNTPKKSKPVQSDPTRNDKSDEPKKERGSKGGYDGFGSMDGIDLDKITLWKDVTDKKKATILEFARAHLEAKTSTVNGLKALILNKYKVKVWARRLAKALEVVA